MLTFPFLHFQRVRLILAAKGIANEEINIHLKLKPEWFLSKINPYGLVPVIEHDGHLIRESRIAFGTYNMCMGICCTLPIHLQCTIALAFHSPWQAFIGIIPPPAKYLCITILAIRNVRKRCLAQYSHDMPAGSIYHGARQ